MAICIIIKRKKAAHFWHWFMGEFLPVVYLISKYPNHSRIKLYNKFRKWGSFPLDKFYKEIDVNKKIIYTNILPSKTRKIKITKNEYGWDNLERRWGECTMKRIKIAVAFLKKKAVIFGKMNGWDKKINQIKNSTCVQLRMNHPDLTEFYKNTGIKKYGSDKKRAISGLDKLHDHCTKSIIYFFADGKGLYHQLYPYLYCKSIVLGHGAGMVWLLFMPQNSRILEICPHGKEKWKKMIQRMVLLQKIGIYKQYLTKDKFITWDEDSRLKEYLTWCSLNSSDKKEEEEEYTIISSLLDECMITTSN